MKITTLITLVVGKPGEATALPPGEYDKKELVGANVDDLEARGFAVVQKDAGKGEAA